jgi:hypothetical protein
MEVLMSNIASIGHTAIKVADINGMTGLISDLLGFTVRNTAGDGDAPSNVWFVEGLQLVHDPEYAGPEGRMHHLGIAVADREAMSAECRSRGYEEVRPNWFALPDGLVLEFLAS